MAPPPPSRHSPFSAPHPTSPRWNSHPSWRRTRLNFLAWKWVSPPPRIHAEGPSPFTPCSHSPHHRHHTSAHAHEHPCMYTCNVHMCVGTSGPSPGQVALSLHSMPPQASPLELCTWPECVACVSLPEFRGGWTWGRLLRVSPHPALQPVYPLLICLPLFLLLSPEAPDSGALHR